MIIQQRNDLYEMLWSQGLVKTAKNLGTTAAKLKEAALKASIPLPTARYWTMRIPIRLQKRLCLMRQ